MKTGLVILFFGLFLSACSVKKTATGSSTAQAKSNAVQFLPGRWLVADVSLPSQVANMPGNADGKTMEEMAAKVKGKAYVEFKTDSSFTFVLPGVGEIDKGTWQPLANGDVSTTNGKGKVTLFKAADLSQGKFDIKIAVGKEEPQKELTLHFKRADK